MQAVAKRALKKIKLAVIWVRRILLAPSHFDVSLPVRLRMNLNGFLADQYALYDLKGSRRREYLSEFDWYRSRWINEPFDSMLNNKIICTEVLQQYVYVPKLLAMKSKGRMTSLERNRADGYLSEKDIYELLVQYGVLFIKPLAAGKGKGVYRLEAVDGSLTIDGAFVSRDDLCEFLRHEDNWFLSEGVRQHAFLDSIYEKTTNTIRLITFRDPKTGVFKIFFAVQRIGTSATIPVDNGSRGGLVSQINLDTGELSVAKSLHSMKVHDFHPDSGAPIKGIVIPDWLEIKQKMLELARSLPYVNFIAWDILLTERGICVIEANTSSGVNIIQLWGAQRNGELGDFYRAHGVIE